MPVLPGLPEVEITLRRSARARRFSLRVSSLDGQVTLSMPARAREAEALAFAEQAKVTATVASDRLENINQIFARMHAGQIEGRIVFDMSA